MARLKVPKFAFRTEKASDKFSSHLYQIPIKNKRGGFTFVAGVVHGEGSLSLARGRVVHRDVVIGLRHCELGWEK